MQTAEPYLAREFPLQTGFIHLNHAAVGPWPRRASDAACAFARENTTQGSKDYPAWVRVETSLRNQFRELLNAPSRDDIGLLKSTSEGLSMVAHGLDWRLGDEVVISDQEFPSNRIVWESVAKRGVHVKAVDLYSGVTPEDALFAACGGRTRLLSISSVQYSTGLAMDLERIGKFCRERGILFCVDAIQSLCVLPMDVQAFQIDFLAADGHKWMLGPEGLAVFYVRPELRERLELHEFGWHMVDAMGDYDRHDWQPASTARRFECGSPNMLGVHVLHASLSLLLEVGLENVSRNILSKTSYLIVYIKNNERLELISMDEAKRRSGIVSFRVAGADQSAVHGHLSRAGVFCALRGGNLRFSPHFYTPEIDLDQALEQVLAY